MDLAALRVRWLGDGDKKRRRRGCWVDEGLKGDGRQEIWDRVPLFSTRSKENSGRRACQVAAHTCRAANDNAGTVWGRDFAATVRSQVIFS